MAPPTLPPRPLAHRLRPVRHPGDQEAHAHRRIQRPDPRPRNGGKRPSARGNRYLYEVSTHRTIDGTGRRNIARYFNHSCNPNAESVIWRGRVFIKTLRNIKPGEEITYDYGTDYLKNVIGRSNCKCSRCRRRRAKRARELRAAKKRRAARLKRQRRAKRNSKR